MTTRKKTPATRRADATPLAALIQTRYERYWSQKWEPMPFTVLATELVGPGYATLEELQEALVSGSKAGLFELTRTHQSERHVHLEIDGRVFNAVL